MSPDMKSFEEMMRKMAEMGEKDSEEKEKQAKEILTIFIDKPTRIEQHTAVLRQGFLSVMTWVLRTMGSDNMDKTKEAITHLRQCMDTVLKNHKFIDTDKLPGDSLIYTMRPGINEDD